MDGKWNRKNKHPHYSANWGPEFLKLRNVIYAEQRRLGITNDEFMLGFYKQTDPLYWLTEEPWKKAHHRFFIEVALNVIKVIRTLENSPSREEYLEGLGLTSREAKSLIGKTLTRQSYPAIAARFNKQLTKASKPRGVKDTDNE